MLRLPLPIQTSLAVTSPQRSAGPSHSTGGSHHLNLALGDQPGARPSARGLSASRMNEGSAGSPGSRGSAHPRGGRNRHATRSGGPRKSHNASGSKLLARAGRRKGRASSARKRGEPVQPRVGSPSDRSRSRAEPSCHEADGDAHAHEYDTCGNVYKDKKFHLQHFKDITNIRRVTKGQFKELGQMLAEGKGRIPIFGYPLVCFSPQGEAANPRERP